MRSPFFFIVKPIKGKRYNNSKEIGGIDFITSTSEENHAASNREGIVVSTPLGYAGEIEPGDTLLVHHNVFKFYNDMRGRQQSGKSYFKDDLFFIDDTQFFMYKKKNKWICHNKYCFIKPIPAIKTYIHKPFAEEPLMGKIRYINKKLLSKGLKEGDLVTFRPETEYEFNVDGEKLYRMFDHHVTMVL
tara:strand:- start:2167 stop:2730 length:564 start_codon:yes stop_codon:yes gene_type:complete